MEGVRGREEEEKEEGGIGSRDRNIEKNDRVDGK